MRRGENNSDERRGAALARREVKSLLFSSRRRVHRREVNPMNSDLIG
jgi:hypothetical protein